MRHFFLEARLQFSSKMINFLSDSKDFFSYFKIVFLQLTLEITIVWGLKYYSDLFEITRICCKRLEIRKIKINLCSRN